MWNELEKSDFANRPVCCKNYLDRNCIIQPAKIIRFQAQFLPY